MDYIEKQQVKQFYKLELFARSVVEGFITGLHRSPFHGFSVEFAEHRIYNSGESTRHIDWKLYGRTEKLFIKRFQEETNLRCQFVLDKSSSMFFPKPENGVMNKFEFSCHAIAALVELFRKQRDAYGLTTFLDEIETYLPAKNNSAHHKQFYFRLEEELKQQGKELQKTNLSKNLNATADMVHQRSLIMVFSDFIESSADLDELMNALQHLKYNRHEVVLFHVMDSQLELNFNFENRNYRFVDVESGEEIKLNPTHVQEEVKRRNDIFLKELNKKCGMYGVDLVTADIHEGFSRVLTSYLIKRQKMIK